jgi:hypothetical protein
MTFHSYWPKGTVKAVLYLSLGSIWICQNPDFISDVHHGNYNPSCKAKTNMQEDSNGPMTRARAKQLQRVLTSQIGMIEAASELKISNQFEIGSRMFICLQLELGDGKSP